MMLKKIVLGTALISIAFGSLFPQKTNAIEQGSYLIKDFNSKQCLHTRSASKDIRADIITWTCRDDEHFKYEFIPVTSRFIQRRDNLYYIRDVNSGNCLHIKAASVENRAPVWTWKCSEVYGESHAMFKLIRVNSYNPNLFYIQDNNSRKCLHVKAASHELRSPIWTWNCSEIDGESHAMFELIPSR